MASSFWNSPQSLMGHGDTPTGDDILKSSGLYTYKPTGQTQQNMANDWAKQQQDLAMAQRIDEAKRASQPQVQYGSNREMEAAADNARRTAMTPAGGGAGYGMGGATSGDERSRRAMLLLGSIMSRRNPNAPQYQDFSGERAALYNDQALTKNPAEFSNRAMALDIKQQGALNEYLANLFRGSLGAAAVPTTPGRSV